MTVLPEGWRSVRLGDVADTALGKMLDAARPKGTTRVPYLRNVNVQWGRVDLSDVSEVMLSDDELQRFALADGDLLVCEGGDVGRAAIWHGERGYMAYQKALHRVRAGDDLDLKFLRYLLEHYAITGELRERATGSTILHLPQQRLRELPIPLPPVDEQLRIVEILEDHLSRIEASQRSFSTCGGRLAAMRTAIALHTFREGSAHGEWQTKSLGNVADVVEYGTSAKAHLEPCAQDLPVLRMGNVQDGRIDWNSLKYLRSNHPDAERLRLESGDMLFNRTNSAELVGKSAVYHGERPATFASYLIRVRFSDLVNPDWASLVINSPLGRRYVASVVSQQVGQANVNGTKLRGFPIPLPPREEQEALMRRIESLTVDTRRLQFRLVALTLRTKLLRSALLRMAFEGRLTGRTVGDDVSQELLDV